jgi:arylformamidase
MAKQDWIDISLPLNNNLPVLPSSVSENPVPPPRFERFSDMEKGDRVTMSRIDMASHDGTHIDAPLHFFYGGRSIDDMSLDTAIGYARIIEIKDRESIKVKELESHEIQTGERILFKTRNSPTVYETRVYEGDCVTLTSEAAVYLAGKKLKLVGLDYLTLGNVKSPETIRDVHEILLGNGVYILEGINLAGVKPGDYELICLPLRLEKGDAGPCRAIIRSLK